MAVESQDVLFEDVITFTLPPRTASKWINVCDIFAATVEPGTLRVTAVLPDHPVPIRAWIEGACLQVRFSPQPWPLRITITLHGVRRGQLTARERVWTPAQAAHNNAFYAAFHEVPA